MRFFLTLAATLFSFSALAIAPVSAPALPAPAATYLEGKDYTLLEDVVRPADPSKIEVVEVFSYHCPHCYHFEPLVEAWVKKQKADVVFVPAHASWAPFMEPLQRGFYTVVALKLQDKAQHAVFSAYQDHQNQLATPESWADVLEPFGVSKKTVIDTYNSFGVASQVRQADARIRAYKITGTPTIIIDGKYRVSAPTAATPGENPQEAMLKISQFLVDKTRAERTAKQ